MSSTPPQLRRRTKTVSFTHAARRDDPAVRPAAQHTPAPSPDDAREQHAAAFAILRRKDEVLYSCAHAARALGRRALLQLAAGPARHARRRYTTPRSAKRRPSTCRRRVRLVKTRSRAARKTWKHGGAPSKDPGAGGGAGAARRRHREVWK